LLVGQAKHEVNYDDPRWYRNIILKESTLSKLAELLPEHKIEKDSDVYELMKEYQERFLSEVEPRIRTECSSTQEGDTETA